MGKSATIEANMARRKSMEESLKVFAEENNLYKATKSFLENGLGIQLWVNSPDTPQNDYFKLE